MILMQLNSEIFNNIALQYVVGNAEYAEGLSAIKPLRIFDNRVLEFLGDLSKVLMKSSRVYSDVITLGYWCRRASILKESKKYEEELRLGKGVAFHIAPSNVPVNFAFSLVSGLLAGNANVVRIPSKDFPQVTIICDSIRELLNGEFKDLAPYILLVRYGHEKAITDAFSSLSSVRIIWGGDSTINTIRESALPPRANEITFADRHSIAVVDADEYLTIKDKDRVAQEFYNDTYFSDQNACTSPVVIIWIGKEKDKAKAEFWKYIHNVVKERYELASVQTVSKLTELYLSATDIEVKRVKDNITDVDELIYRIKVQDLDGVVEHKYNSGFFFEYDADKLSEILPLCTENCQTITYCGVAKETIESFIVESRPRGVDRVVPMGKSMDFALIWDGHDLIREMSRNVTIL